MASVNKVILLGNVTRDLELKSLANGSVVNFGLACNRKWTSQGGEKKEEVCFVDCAAFGKSAETLNKYVKKGDPLFVVGRLKLDQWESKEGGKRTKLSVVVDEFQFIGGRKQDDGQQKFDEPGPETNTGDDLQF